MFRTVIEANLFCTVCRFISRLWCYRIHLEKKLKHCKPLLSILIKHIWFQRDSVTYMITIFLQTATFGYMRIMLNLLVRGGDFTSTKPFNRFFNAHIWGDSNYTQNLWFAIVYGMKLIFVKEKLFCCYSEAPNCGWVI